MESLDYPVRIKDRGIEGGGFDFKSGVMDKGPGGSYFFSETEGTDVYSEGESDKNPDLSKVAEDDPARGSYESWVKSLEDDDDDDDNVDTGLGSEDYSTAYGGQIGQGMQAGGPAGFIGGPPEKYNDQTTIADDIPLEVPEGAFVINAPAVEYAGSQDISKMLTKAYEKAGQRVDKSGQVTKIPSKEQVDIMISRGEVVVPPNIAKIIGYDRLEKINNRGKREVARRQKQGDKEKPQELPLLIATEQPEMWSRCKVREVHCGHKHKEMLNEYMGCLLYTSPSPRDLSTSRMPSSA